MPYKSIPNGTFCEFSFELKEVPTQAECNEITQNLKQIFGYDVNVLPPELPDLLVEQFNSTSLLTCAVVMLIVIFNASLIYMFVLEKRKKWLSIIKLCGCKNDQCSVIFLTEIVFIIIICFIIGLYISNRFVIPKFIDQYPVFDVVYNTKSYGYIFLAYIVSSIIILLANIQPFVKRTVVDMQRGNK